MRRTLVRSTVPPATIFLGLLAPRLQLHDLQNVVRNLALRRLIDRRILSCGGRHVATKNATGIRCMCTYFCFIGCAFFFSLWGFKAAVRSGDALMR
jgi:hypothetical protein